MKFCRRRTHGTDGVPHTVISSVDNITDLISTCVCPASNEMQQHYCVVTDPCISFLSITGLPAPEKRTTAEIIKNRI